MKDTASPNPTPEQLLAILAAHRGERVRRRPRKRSRAYLLAAAVLVIILVAGVAFMMLGQMLAEMHGQGAFRTAGAP